MCRARVHKEHEVVARGGQKHGDVESESYPEGNTAVCSCWSICSSAEGALCGVMCSVSMSTHSGIKAEAEVRSGSADKTQSKHVVIDLIKQK